MSNIGMKPRNKTEVQITELTTKAHDFLAKKLNVESTLKFGRTWYWGTKPTHLALWRNSEKTSVINFSTYVGGTVKHMLGAIGHELRHAEQYRDGLKTRSRHDDSWTNDGVKMVKGIWRGELYKGTYWDAPWEIDARAHQDKYAQMIIDAGILTKKELNVKLPGVRKNIVLEKEAYTKIYEKHGYDLRWFKASVSNKKLKARDKILTDAGYFRNAKGRWELAPGADSAKAKKALAEWKKTPQYRNDAIAFLTRLDARKYKNNNERYEAAQKNAVIFKTRKADLEDFVL